MTPVFQVLNSFHYDADTSETMDKPSEFLSCSHVLLFRPSAGFDRVYSTTESTRPTSTSILDLDVGGSSARVNRLLMPSTSYYCIPSVYDAPVGRSGNLRG